MISVLLFLNANVVKSANLDILENFTIDCQSFDKRKWGAYMEVNDPALYESMTGKIAKEPVIEISETKEEIKKIDTHYDELDAYQKKRDAERAAELEKAREKLKKKEVKFNFIAPRKDWSVYGGWVNAHLPVNEGKLGSTQGWRIEKPEKEYY